MNLTDTDKADLKAARDNFAKMMQGLTPKQQMNRAYVIAGGIREADPLTQALAQQVVDAHQLNTNIEGYQREIEEIDAIRLNNATTYAKGQVLARRNDVETKMHEDVARLVALSEDGLESSERKALAHFREMRQRDERQARIAEAVARKKVEAEQAEIDALADRIVGLDRFKLGKSGSAGDSQ